ncbi:MAG: ABC transporter ATP-binding protein [Clostridia bacterium]
MLKITNLQVSYGAIKAVKGISLELNEGEIVAIIGNNGAGKTSTLNSICGVIKPAGGTIELFGESIGGLNSDMIAKKGIALVPEGRKIFAGMTTLENLEMGAFLRKDKDGIKKDFRKVFDLFPILEERKFQKGGTLSGGEQQMLAIGRAMMSNPKVMLFDEPSLGIAPLVVKNIFNTIKEINKTGIPVLIVEQNVYLSLAIADRGYVLETGEIIISDKSENLLNNDMVKKAYLGIDEEDDLVV